MEKTIYVIYRERVEERLCSFGARKPAYTVDDIQDAVWRNCGNSAELLGEFEDKEEALKSFETYEKYASTYDLRGQLWWLLIMETYRLEEQRVEVDEDGDMDYIDGDTIAFCAQPFPGDQEDEE